MKRFMDVCVCVCVCVCNPNPKKMSFGESEAQQTDDFSLFSRNKTQEDGLAAETSSVPPSLSVWISFICEAEKQSHCCCRGSYFWEQMGRELRCLMALFPHSSAIGRDFSWCFKRRFTVQENNIMTGEFRLIHRAVSSGEITWSVWRRSELFCLQDDVFT